MSYVDEEENIKINLMLTTTDADLGQVLNHFQSQIDSIKDVTSQSSLVADSLQSQILSVASNYGYICDMTSIANESIANQLSAINTLLAVVSVILAIVGIGLGVYISKKAQDVEKLNKDSQKAQATSKEILRLINEDINGLYERLKEAETENLIKRLMKVPEDIGNLSELLLSRDIPDSLYGELKKAYLSFKDKQKSTPDYYGGLNSYKLLIYQNFIGLAICDPDIKSDIITFSFNAMNSAFESDMEEITRKFFSTAVKVGLASMKADVKKFFSDLSQSRHKDYDKLYEIIFDVLGSRENHFEFLSMVNEASIDKDVLKKYCRILEEYYKDFSQEEQNAMQYIV